MTCSTTPTSRCEPHPAAPLTRWLALAVVLAVMPAGGCASPPSVVPLLEVVASAVGAEAEQLQADTARLEDDYTARQQALRAGFEADLAERQPLERDWVAEHVRVYVAACQALAESYHRRRSALVQRRANLSDAALAQRRAIALLEQQDRLLAGLPDLRRWLEGPAGSNDSTGTNRSTLSPETDR